MDHVGGIRGLRGVSVVLRRLSRLAYRRGGNTVWRTWRAARCLFHNPDQPHCFGDGGTGAGDLYDLLWTSRAAGRAP